MLWDTRRIHARTRANRNNKDRKHLSARTATAQLTRLDLLPNHAGSANSDVAENASEVAAQTCCVQNCRA